MLKQIISINCLMTMLLLLSSCQSKEKAFLVEKEKEFLVKYEFEDFSQYNDVDMLLRGSDKQGNFIVLGYAPYFVNDSSKVGYYVVTLDKTNHQVIEAEWASTKDYVNADTVKLQQLAQTFMKYKISRLRVDKQGNVFVYLVDFERFTLARFVNESELQKRSKEMKWVNIKNNWYKPK